MSIEFKAKTIGEINKEGKESYCRGCYTDSVEDCKKCFWQTEKWVPLEEAKKLECIDSDLDNIISLLTQLKNCVNDKFIKAKKILDEESSMNNESDELDFRMKQLEHLREALK
jgi:hypothetical protein